MTSVISLLLFLYARDVHSWPTFGLLWTVDSETRSTDVAPRLRQELVKKMFANPPDTPGIRVGGWNTHSLCIAYACLCVVAYTGEMRNHPQFS